jgi:catechol-2,3-dioxygenase
MSTVGRLVYSVFDTPDVDRLAAYHRDVLGLREVTGDGDGVALSAGLDHHAVWLQKAERSGIAAIGFQLSPGTELDDAAAAIRAAGGEAERRSDALPGVAEMLAARDPEGNDLHLFTAIERSSEPAPTAGAAPRKLGHICLRTGDVPKLTAWYEETLGFAWSDWLGDFFSFLRCGSDHHSLNLLKGEAHGNVLHHIAYELRDMEHVQSACDALSASGHPLVWGPGRHGPGHNVFTYHHGADDHVVELFTQMDVVAEGTDGHFEPRPWHEDSPPVRKVWEPGPLTPNSWGITPPPDFI